MPYKLPVIVPPTILPFAVIDVTVLMVVIVFPKVTDELPKVRDGIVINFELVIDEFANFEIPITPLIILELIPPSANLALVMVLSAIALDVIALAAMLVVRISPFAMREPLI